ncbi:PaaI family thioesterase [Sphingorhabdus sp. 109]|uniref:PaaI family thioesterase n=1 Tax=Sphingorhabdus sp. 109 TaxID=2653173 RepID=UPI0012F097EF|nr:PaaI family thioesterase [Sphingorhabdus sp. 109]VWX60522.1 Thioesterase superfamily protein [Sphingorhabdus sp. 109]
MARNDTLADDPQGGAQEHFRALERLYAQAPINQLFQSRLEIPEAGTARILFAVDERYYHAAGAVHGTSYFKMLDDAAFYAANSLVSDRFILTTAFNLLFTKPLKSGPVTAEGRWVSGKRRVFVADARLIDSEGDEIARGTGTFMRSHIPLASLPGYKKDD